MWETTEARLALLELLTGAGLKRRQAQTDAFEALAELPEHIAGDEALALMVLVGVVVGAIDHDRAGDAFAGDGRFGLGDVLRFIIGLAAAAAEDDVAVRVAGRPDDRGLPL